MKALFILFALTTFLLSCNKNHYRPDWDAVSCARVWIYSQAYTDTTSGIKIGEPVLIWPQGGGDPTLCGPELEKVKRALPYPWQGLCDADGAKYWVYTYGKYN